MLKTKFHNFIKNLMYYNTFLHQTHAKCILGVNLFFKSFQLGNIQLNHRIIMGSMHLGLEKEGNSIEQMAEFYSRRFAGGVEFITTGGIAVNHAGKGSLHFFNFKETNDIPKLEKLNALLDGQGNLCAQLFHAGRYAFHRELTAPSAIRAPINRYLPHELNLDEIKETISAFAHAALKAKNCGFKAVEIMGSEGYLLNEFFSAVTNRRQDKYGVKRNLILEEVASAVREAVGTDFPIIFRMSGIDLIPGNPSKDEIIHLAQLLEKSGVTALNIGIGWHESRIPTISALVPRGAFSEIARIIKQAVNIPVIASNRINHPNTINEILVSGQADIISMARPFLADPDIVYKMKTDNTQSINTCIACNQACLDHTFKGERVSCLVNPEANREKEFTLPHIHTRKTVTVIGAGPAGMQSALTLAKHGFQVELIDKKNEIGGQLQMAATIPGKSEFLETIRYFKHEIMKNNISIKLNTEIKPGEFEALDSDYTVIACGTKPKKVNLPGMENLPYGYYDDFLTGKFIPGTNVIVIGAGGIGCDVAHLLVKKRDLNTGEYYNLYNINSWIDPGIKEYNPGITVNLLRRNGKIGAGLGMTTGWAILQELQAGGVTFHTSLIYKKITRNGILIQQKNGGEELIQGDSIIICAGQEPIFAPEILKKENVYIIGSCHKPDYDAKDSFLEGLITAKKIIQKTR